METSLMNDQHVNEDYAAMKIQILSPINGPLNKKMDFGKRNKDTLGLEQNRPSIAVGLLPNSSAEQMPSCCSRPVNIAIEMGRDSDHKGKHVTRPHQRNGPSIAAGFPPNSGEEQMPSYCSR
ncbi:hypothetical protein Ancab_022112 [Ancistrocladus abbreviatus]